MYNIHTSVNVIIIQKVIIGFKIQRHLDKKNFFCQKICTKDGKKKFVHEKCLLKDLHALFDLFLLFFFLF